MDEWVKENIKKHCPYIKRLEAVFVQAADDNINVLTASFGFDEKMTIGGMDVGEFIHTMKNFNQ